jgi:hypothetical protein
MDRFSQHRLLVIEESAELLAEVRDRDRCDVIARYGAALVQAIRGPARHFGGQPADRCGDSPGRAWRDLVGLPGMRVAFATCSPMAEGSEDDYEAAQLLGADFCVWDDESVNWSAYDRVVLRSVWDYSRRVTEFLDWCQMVGPGRLRNRPELVAFSADKQYLAQLSAPSVPTTFVGPGEAAPVLDGEVVIKPNVSAGARDTGRFGPAKHADALALIGRIQAGGRVALIQPYMPAVDVRGETGLVFIGGELSHVLHKRAVLRPDEVAPVSGTELAVAAVMLEDDLVRAGNADPAQLAVAIALHTEISDRFGTPLYLRIDLIDGPDGVPLLLELEAVEPSLYLNTSPGASERLARAVRLS